MKKLITAVACLAALAAAFFVAAPASAATYDPAQISMARQFTGLCLNDMSWASAPGSPVVIWACQAYNKSEDWTVAADGTISPESAPGDVLDIVNGKAVLEPAGTQVAGDWQGGNPSTAWLVENVGLTASNGTETVLNDPAWSHANGTQLIAWEQTRATANAQFNVPAPAPSPAPSPAPPPSPAPGGNVYTGMYVGATYYGASGTNDAGTSYAISNCRQGGSLEPGGAYALVNGQCVDSTGSTGLDDNGVGACGGAYDNLAVPPGVITWAEDGKNGNINDGVFGNLPCGTKLQITYNGHTVVAEKADISDGGCGSNAYDPSCLVNGAPRALDLWWQSAKALCFANQPDVMYVKVVPSSTPTTAVPPFSWSKPSTYQTC